MRLCWMLDKLECAWLRVVRKNLVISSYPLIDKTLSESLRSAPELERFVLPPTGFNDALLYELAVHDGVFRQLLDYSEPDLESELRVIQTIEASLEESLRKAPKHSPIYRDSAFTWFEHYGVDGKHFAFKHIAENLEITPRPGTPFSQA